MLGLVFVWFVVALRKESVDRNINNTEINKHDGYVALRKESVDRNLYWVLSDSITPLSLSARRAWIEMRA